MFAVAYKAQVTVLSGSAVFVFLLHEAEHFNQNITEITIWPGALTKWQAAQFF